MSNVLKIPKSTAQAIAEMELEKLYQKSLSSELSLEDTKKYDILVKTLTEVQKESAKELEAKFFKLKKEMLASLPNELLEHIAGQNPGPDNNDTQTTEESASSASAEGEEFE